MRWITITAMLVLFSVMAAMPAAAIVNLSP